MSTFTRSYPPNCFALPRLNSPPRFASAALSSAFAASGLASAAAATTAAHAARESAVTSSMGARDVARAGRVARRDAGARASERRAVTGAREETVGIARSSRRGGRGRRRMAPSRPRDALSASVEASARKGVVKGDR